MWIQNTIIFKQNTKIIIVIFILTEEFKKRKKKPWTLNKTSPYYALLEPLNLSYFSFPLHVPKHREKEKEEGPKIFSTRFGASKIW